jgi:hypothetical protein
MHTSSSSLGSWAAGKSAGATGAGIWAAGCFAPFGNREPVRYAAIRLGAVADAPSVGIRCEFTRGVQHSAQPDGLRAARSSRRLAQRYAS